MSEKNEKITHLTKAGLKKYEERLAFLKGENTMRIAARLEEARGHGDLSENSEYDDAKQEQSDNALEIEKIEAILANYDIIDEEGLDTDTVKMGQIIVLYDCEFEETTEYYLVGSTEADPMNGKISNESPVGQAILGHRKGETVTVPAPGGNFEYKIVDIKIPEM